MRWDFLNPVLARRGIRRARHFCHRLIHRLRHFRGGHIGGLQIHLIGQCDLGCIGFGRRLRSGHLGFLTDHAVLQLRKLIVLQRQQLLHVLQPLLQVVDLGAQGLGLLPRGLRIFTCRDQTRTQVTGRGRCRGVVVTCTRFALAFGACSGDPQLVLCIRCRRIGACRRHVGRRLFGGALQFLIALREPGILLLTVGLSGLRATQLLDLGGAWYPQDLALAQTVDIAVDKGIGIGIEQRDHHLLHAYTTWPQLLGDTPRCVIGLDRAVLGTTTRRHRLYLACRFGRRCGRPGRCSRWHRSSAAPLRCRRYLGWTTHGRGRRIEQYRVFAQQSAVRPVHFEQKIQKRLADREFRGHADDRRTLCRKCGFELEQRQVERSLHAGTLEGIWVSQLDSNRVELFRLHRKQRDVTAEILIQSRFRAEFAQTECMNRNTHGPQCE